MGDDGGGPAPAGGGSVGTGGIGGIGGRVGGRRRRWPIVVVAVVVVAIAVGFPVRDRLTRREFHGMEHEWAQALADDIERASAESHLTVYAGFDESPAVNAALATLYQEEGRRFDSLRAGLHRSVLVDTAMAAIRSDMATALAHRSALLARVAAYYQRPVEPSPPPNADDQTAVDGNRVDVALSAARARWGERPPPPLTSAPYTAERSALSRLSHWLDEPTGAVILAPSRGQLVRLDIDASRITATDVPAAAGDFVMRSGYLAYLLGPEAWSVSSDGSGRPTDLGAAGGLFAAADPGLTWLVDGLTFAATEIDGSGRVVAGPVRSAGVPVAATAGALIESDVDRQGQLLPQLLVWSLAGNQVRCRLGSAASPAGELATSGNLVAWSDGPEEVRVTDVTTCAEKWKVTRPASAGGRPGLPVAAFNPDGRTLAVGAGPIEPVTLVDVASGQVTSIPTDATFPVAALVWTADGSRIFWSSGQFGAFTLLNTWKVGDPRARALRAVRLDITAPLLVVP